MQITLSGKLRRCMSWFILKSSWLSEMRERELKLQFTKRNQVPLGQGATWDLETILYNLICHSAFKNPIHLKIYATLDCLPVLLCPSERESVVCEKWLPSFKSK